MKSQLIQQDLADTGGPVTTADMGIESIQPARLHHEFTSSVQPTPSRPLPAKQGLQGINKGRKKDTKKSVKFDETTVAEIATVAPEQHRMLTSVRKALEDVDLENDLETGAMVMDLHLDNTYLLFVTTSAEVLTLIVLIRIST